MHSTHIVCKQTLFWMWLIQLLSLYYIKLYYISSQDLNKHGILHCEYSAVNVPLQYIVQQV